MKQLKLTPNRLHWLNTVEASKDWERRNGATRHARTGRKMPEPVFWWLIEQRLIETDCNSVKASEKGRTIAEDYRR